MKSQNPAGIVMAACALGGMLWARGAPAADCPETNVVKWVQSPNVFSGADYDASYTLTLADDFNCTDTGPITDIHLWGSWLNDAVGAGATFTLGIWSDVPVQPGNAYSHPGTNLWYQKFFPGQYTICAFANAPEDFVETYNQSVLGYSTNLYYLSFYPSTPFTQTGSANAPTNYWLSVSMEGSGPDTFGWKSSASSYNDTAVYGFWAGGLFPKNWSPLRELFDRPIGFSFKITTLPPPPSISCVGPATIECPDLPMFAAPTVLDVCDPNPTVTFSDSLVPGSCPQSYVVQRAWMLTDQCGNSATCSQTITVVDTTAPVIWLLGDNPLNLECHEPFIEPGAAAFDACDGYVPAIPVGLINVNVLGTYTLTYSAMDSCGNTSQVTRTVNVVDTTPPVLTCAGDKTVLCGECNGFFTYTEIHAFSGPSDRRPYGGVIQGSDGPLYGTVYRASGNAGLFKVNLDGTAYGAVDLAPFDVNPHLIEGSDGTLYGTAEFGANLAGAVFKVIKDGSAFTLLHGFAPSLVEGAQSVAGVIEGSDGALYGTTSYGGSHGGGTVFKLNKDGTGFSTIHNFGADSGDGYNPRCALIEARDGMLYGTTINGPGTSSVGTIFKLNKDGNGFSTIHSFEGTSLTAEYSPQAGLLEGTDGALYGTTRHGGPVYDYGILFRLNKDGSQYTVLDNALLSGRDAPFTEGPLTEGKDGMLYGMIVPSATYPRGDYNGAVVRLNKDGSGYKVLYHGTTANDGKEPTGGLLQASDGAFYGTMSSGGSGGSGASFKLECAGFDFDPPAAVDACCGNAVSTMVVSTVTNGVCPQVITRTWQSSDCNGNIAMCSQTVTVMDNSRPTFKHCPSDLDLGCNPATIPPCSPTDVEATDNCSIPTVSCASFDSQSGCVHYRTNIYTATDACGNMATCSQLISWNQNNTPPLLTCEDLTFECGTAWDFRPPLVGGDCGAASISLIILATVTNAGDCGNTFTARRTWLASNSCGNSVTCSQTVTVRDTGRPVFTHCPSDLDLGCNPASIPLCSPADVEAIDNCSVPTIICLSQDGQDGCVHYRTNFYTAIDACGKTATCSQQITWRQDITPPVITCAPDTTVECITPWDFIPPLVSDDCGPLGLSVSILSTVTNSGDCAYPFVARRVWLASDLCGNTAMCTQAVTVVSHEPPALRCSAAKFVQCGQCNGMFDYSQMLNLGGSMGEVPVAGLIEGRDGLLYGVTSSGGTASGGAVFKLSKEGNDYTVLHGFTHGSEDGFEPRGALVEGSDGPLYGTTTGGGSEAVGTVYKLNKDGNNFSLLHSFTMRGPDGHSPIAALKEASDGALYGTTSGLGTSGGGTVFKINKDGTDFTVLVSFMSEGAGSVAPLIEGTDGVLYGTTGDGPGTGAGTLFRLNKDGSGFDTLHFFPASATDGRNPQSALVEGSDGVLYGATPYGGADSVGTVFKLNKDGSGYSVLRSFSAHENVEGQNPRGALVEGYAGALFGTTWGGGSSFVGTIFKLNKDGTGYSLLHEFTGSADGSMPVAGLVKTLDRRFYGTTTRGGPANAGTVYKLACSSRWDFDPPIVEYNRCNANSLIITSSTITNRNCPYLITRTWLAADCSGNSAICSQDVIVLDSTPPAISCPGNLVVVADEGQCTRSNVTFSVDAADSCSAVAISCEPPSGSTFPLGTNLVLCTATDACGNANTCSFKVTVSDRPPVITSQPQSTLKYWGESAAFQVSATACTQLTYQWHDRNGALMGQTASSLALGFVTTVEAGEYHVVVTGGGGSITSAPAILTVAFKPPIIDSAANVTDGRILLKFGGPVGQTYRVLASSDLNLRLESWTVVANGIFGPEPVVFTEPTTSATAGRFYRIASP